MSPAQAETANILHALSYAREAKDHLMFTDHSKGQTSKDRVNKALAETIKDLEHILGERGYRVAAEMAVING
jgi:hypothetical protein